MIHQNQLNKLVAMICWNLLKMCVSSCNHHILNDILHAMCCDILTESIYPVYPEPKTVHVLVISKQNEHQL